MKYNYSDFYCVAKVDDIDAIKIGRASCRERV